jgi:two-component system chemotaxis sensor kinase CheA
VTRLEELPADSIERVGGRELVQYRGEILPLLRLGGPADGRVVAVVVCATRGRSVGLVVDAIVDIVEGTGVAGTEVVHGRITELLDVERAVLQVDPRFYDAAGVSPGGPA